MPLEASLNQLIKDGLLRQAFFDHQIHITRAGAPEIRTSTTVRGARFSPRQAVNSLEVLTQNATQHGYDAGAIMTILHHFHDAGQLHAFRSFSERPNTAFRENDNNARTTLCLVLFRQILPEALKIAPQFPDSDIPVLLAQKIRSAVVEQQ